MMNWKMVLVLGVPLCLLAPTVCVSEEIASESPAVVETFKPPERIKNGHLAFPRRAQLKGQEGWVLMNYMVDPNGTPYDITVVRSSGGKEFEVAARKSVESTEYAPAMLNGVPIDAGSGARVAETDRRHEPQPL